MPLFNIETTAALNPSPYSPTVVSSPALLEPTKNNFLKSKQLLPSTNILSFLVFTTTFSISDRFESLKF